MKRFSPVLLYTSSRLVLFIVTATVLALLGMHGIFLLMVALVVSGLMSYVLLSKQRDAMSAAVVGGGSRLRNRLDARTTAEDEADDEQRAALDPPEES